MRRLLVALAAGLGAPSLVAAHAGHSHGGGGKEGPTNVVELTSTNFDDLVGQDKAVVMDFYAPWCGHCKTLKPELEKLATTFLDSEDVLITKLNGEAFPEYSYRFGVRGFPTIFWFPAGAEKPTQEYWGDRHASALMNWIHGKLEEPNPFKDDPKEPLPDFDLSGTWIDGDGGQMTMTQEKHAVTAKPTQPQHWSSAHGRIKGRTIPRMPFNTIVLAAEISDDDDTITWSNGVAWTRVVEVVETESEPNGEEEEVAEDKDAAAAAIEAAEPAAAATGADADDEEGKAAAAESTPPSPPPPPPSPPPVASKGTQADAKATPTEEPAAAAADDPVASDDDSSKKKTKDAAAKVAATDDGGGSGEAEKQLKKVNADLKKAKADVEHARQQLADSTAKNDAKQKSGRKELMTCREQTLSLQTEIEQRDQYIAVLYCVIGVLAVLLLFQSCRRMGSAADAATADEDAEEAEWAEERHSQMRSQIIAGGSTSSISKAL